MRGKGVIIKSNSGKLPHSFVLLQSQPGIVNDEPLSPFPFLGRMNTNIMPSFPIHRVRQYVASPPSLVKAIFLPPPPLLSYDGFLMDEEELDHRRRRRDLVTASYIGVLQY